MPGCCLVSFNFMWGKLSTRTVTLVIFEVHNIFTVYLPLIHVVLYCGSGFVSERARETLSKKFTIGAHSHQGEPLSVSSKANLGTIKRLCGRGGFTVLLPYNTCTGLIFPKKEAAAMEQVRATQSHCHPIPCLSHRYKLVV